MLKGSLRGDACSFRVYWPQDVWGRPFWLSCSDLSSHAGLPQGPGNQQQTIETVQNLGGRPPRGPPGVKAIRDQGVTAGSVPRRGMEGQMLWRVIVELTGGDGGVQWHKVHVGGNSTAACSAETLGLRLAEAKQIMAALQRHLVQAQIEEHCQIRRRCRRCTAQRPLKRGATGG
jgi:hypothetical protein